MPSLQSLEAKIQEAIRLMRTAPNAAEACLEDAISDLKHWQEQTAEMAALNQRVEQLSLVLQVYDELTSHLSIDHVAMLVLDASLRLSQANGAFIALRQSGSPFVVHQTIGDYDLPDGGVLKDGETLARLIQNRRPLLLKEDSGFTDDLPALKNVQGARLLMALGAQENQIGILCLDTAYPERFTEDVLQLLELLRSYLVIALSNASLYRQVLDQLSELRTAHERVANLEQLKTDMIRLASHDLKNPLSLATGYLQMFQMENPPLQEHLNDYLSSTLNAVYRMNSIVDDILSLERIEQLAETALNEIVNLALQAQHVYTDHLAEAEQKQLSFVYESTLTNAYVTADRVQLIEAMTNLVGNAIKYTPEGGRVVVQLTRSDTHYQFIVIDNGFGIPIERQDRLFQPFYRVQTPETKEVHGTGLGLHLVKNIVARHQGKLIFSSDYGKGSHFGFELMSL